MHVERIGISCQTHHAYTLMGLGKVPVVLYLV